MLLLIDSVKNTESATIVENRFLTYLYDNIILTLKRHNEM